MSGDAPGWFVPLSAALTGHAPVTLWQTGQVAAHARDLRASVGESAWRALHDAAEAVQQGARALDDALASPDVGPVLRALVKLWYLGTWSPLDDTWCAAHPDRGDNAPRVLSAAAHTEALVWRTLGANPMGAKGPGFGSWALAPRVVP